MYLDNVIKFEIGNFKSYFNHMVDCHPTIYLKVTPDSPVLRKTKFYLRANRIVVRCEPGQRTAFRDVLQ